MDFKSRFNARNAEVTERANMEPREAGPNSFRFKMSQILGA